MLSVSRIEPGDASQSDGGAVRARANRLCIEKVVGASAGVRPLNSQVRRCANSDRRLLALLGGPASPRADPRWSNGGPLAALGRLRWGDLTRGSLSIDGRSPQAIQPLRDELGPQHDLPFYTAWWCCQNEVCNVASD